MKPLALLSGMLIATTLATTVQAEEISLTDASAPYASRSCPLTHHIAHKTALPADCRCGTNRSNTGGIHVCQRPYEVARNMGVNIGKGPSFANYYNAHLTGGFIDYANNELIASVQWDAGAESKGLVVAYNLDDWSRRFISGDAEDEYGHKVIAEGPRFFELKEIQPGIDGFWYGFGYEQGKSGGGARIFRINPKTGERHVIWQGRTADYGQCPSGRKTIRRPSQQYVQYTQDVFTVDPKDGSFLVAFSNNKMGGTGLARISPDGSQCDFVTLSGRRDDGLKKGRGFNMRGPMLGIYLHDGKIYTHSTGEKTFFEIDPASGDRKALTRRSPRPPAWRRVVWDEQRKVFWVSGKMNSVTVTAYDPALNKYLVAHKTCGKKSHWGWFPLCMQGPMRINSLNYGPMWLNKNTGNLIFGQDAIGIVEFEPETGNSINRSF
ncbi:MAG: hypothetical protein OIF57_03950 [Marinobacterium sp.]|nr:hypothetical protein [Marinobacterium sp.]